MPQSDFTYRYEFELQLLHIPVQIGVRTDPSINNVESFAAILFFELRDGTRVEVAKVDDSPHEEGDIHVDRFYREIGAEIKDFDVDINDWVAAEEYLKENGERFIRLYEDNHNLLPRKDGENV